MDIIVIGAAAFFTSCLTLFSGFGLGTLLLPAFAVFFPVETAVGLTAVVHFLNNLFKLALLGGRADKGVVLRFGLPAAAASFAGAYCLLRLSELPPLFRYEAFGRDFAVAPVGFAVGLLMALFALAELWPPLAEVSFDRRYLPWGGVLSGFFGGLAGHQGALRSAFLVRCGLSKEAFIASGVVVACLVDVVRLSVYGKRFAAVDAGANGAVLLVAVLSAFLGAWLGRRLIPKVTVHAVRLGVGFLLLGTSFLLIAGII